jgi:hypothetical protein
MTSKKHVVLYNDSAAGSGNWYPLNSDNCSIQVNMNASDTVLLQGTTRNAKDATDLGTVAAEDITTIETFTGSTDANGVIVGSFTFIRVTKTGTAGVAKVQGNL